ncbi:rab11 family-interacting protein 4 isoform X1 [Diabrotica virgifera virgifera]|uniref:FIP-RBD domain-containing protein n=1 Tax=Diabrotica virgifera virgifera TaxID=50390 RepID=A0ABM5KTT8_DIAVI|nr:rab11 family-interacting protein 4 isoform X1 [Diabrotica virgifera virgifera]
MMSPTTKESTVLVNGTSSGTPSFVLTPEHVSQNSEPNKSQCSSLSDVENLEWSAETLEVDPETSGNGNNVGNELRTVNGINRNTWLRTSLRRSSPSHPENLANRRCGSFRHNGRRQQLGSNALASQLYRSSSFNSSGRSSTCDTTDDMYSDASLEEDVLDLHQKFQVLQQQVGYLQDTANQNDERYTRAKADNAALQARVIMLEEQLRETEMRSEEKLQDERRGFKDQKARLEREKQLLLDNVNLRLQASETECANLKKEINRQKDEIDKYKNERQNLMDQVSDLTSEVTSVKEEMKMMKSQEIRLKREYEAQVQLSEDLSKEIERLRLEARTPALPTTSPETLRLEELHEEMTNLRSENSELREVNEELQASLLHAGLETGRILSIGENSLAAELDVMSQDEVQKALKEQQEVNRQLRTYIEGILLNIVENHPQLLEVKHRPV